ncbi:MAG: hypothetical protein KDA81_07565 [Planctomycetaceae bacterium]|nr:hypothetical protein [Planctomycetaceae bacterium]
MLRKGIVALMMTVMSVGSLQADDAGKPGKLSNWLKGPTIGRPNHSAKSTPSKSGVKHAVIDDAEKQVPEIRQTSGDPQTDQLEPAESVPQPLPIQYAPVVPNTTSVSGPQYFSAVSDNGSALPVHPGSNWQAYSPPYPVYQNSGSPYSFASGTGPQVAGPVSMRTVSADGMMYDAGTPMDGSVIAGPQPMGGGYGQGNTAALYPAPKPGIPHQVGGTAIVNQAFHPHEMLYPHQYRAMYGPYYYKVNGGWVLTPFGIWSKEHWQLQGTMVDVKYNSHISPFTMFKPPVIR